jgi:hypothetical protein
LQCRLEVRDRSPAFFGCFSSRAPVLVTDCDHGGLTLGWGAEAPAACPAVPGVKPDLGHV